MSATPAVTASLQSIPYQVTLSDDLGHTWLADEPTELGGGNAGPSPDRLMLASLGSCTAITIQMVANRRQWPLTGIRVALQLNPDGKPETGNDIVRHIELTGDLSQEQREQLLKIANACPMHKLLSGEVRIHSDLR
ncbi:OsmC family protein [Undibacterium griseum]|uniref:OsmC family protein n=1 Tax=Undibacterium griseum TaxID=2762295 RepID=A0ABR6YJ27_9BURK|nr:OsmC family protein [Undibacterium griseum]MBC3883828.1 OsmC family protein [Undibacterium griseum]